MLLRLLEKQVETLLNLTLLTQRTLSGLWRTLSDPTDHALVRSYAAESLDVLEDAQELVVESVGAYFDEVLEEMDVPYRTPHLLGLPEYPRTVENPIHVWERPAEQYRYYESQGMPKEQALEKAVERAEKLAKDDLMLTKRKATHFALQNAPILGYRRVIHPEMSATGTCGLCIAASTRIYKASELLPMHNSCNCEVLPITHKNDPGNILNQADLSELYALAGGTGANLLTKVKYKVDEHGELGPYLVPEARTKPMLPPKPATNKVKIQAQIDSLLKTLPELREKVKTQPTYMAAVHWQEKRLEKLRKELASGR